MKKVYLGLARITTRRPSLLVLCALLSVAPVLHGDILFEADSGSGNIYKFISDSSRSTFASGLNAPTSLSFDSSGNLFEGDGGSGNIYKFTSGGSRSTFASGLNGPLDLVFDSTGNLFEADAGSGNIYEFTSGGS
jgi:hypothetical protein